MNTLVDFPTMGAEQLSSLRRFIDGGFRSFSREYGETLEHLFDPLREFLIFSERLLTQSPWPIVIGAIALIAWLAKTLGCPQSAIELIRGQTSRRKTLSISTDNAESISRQLRALAAD